MITFSGEELKEILKKHKLWIDNKQEGVRAYLMGADLRGAYLREADLSGAYLMGADLRGAYLREADLSEAYLNGADLSGADLKGADLREADLSGADLSGADLKGADLRGADLNGADLNGADIFWPTACPEKGSFIGFKKCKNDLIVELKITEDAKRCSATGRKCRCSKAEVISITNIDGSASNVDKAISKYNKNFIYEIGKTVEVTDFDENRWNECSTGIHFFITRQEAVDYR